MAAPIPEVTDLNLTKFISLFSETGRDCFLKAFYSFVPKANIQTYFQSDKIQNRIDDLSKRGILVGDQYDKLKDNNIQPDEFDLAMLFVLLRYVIEEVQAPDKGWHSLPSVGDNSLGACLLKMQRIRNKVVHNPNVELSDDEFEEKWDDLAHYLRTVIESVGGEEDSKEIRKKIRELKKTSKEDLSRNLAKNVKQVFLWSESDITRFQSRLSAGQVRSNTSTQQSQDGLDEPDAVRNDTATVQMELETITNEFQTISGDELPTQADVLPSTSTDSSHVNQKLHDMTLKANDIITWVQTLMLRHQAQAPQGQTAQEVQLGTVAQSTVHQNAIYNYGASDSLNIFDGEMTISGTLAIGSGLGENSLQSFRNNSSGTKSSLPSFTSPSSVQGSSGSTVTIVTNVAGQSSINVMGGKLNTAPGSYIYIQSKFHRCDLNAKTASGSKDVPDSSAATSGQFKKKHDDTMTETMVDCFANHMKSVAALIIEGDVVGTAFRVGKKFLMTAAHVVKHIVDPDKRKKDSCIYLNSVKINFNSSPMDSSVYHYTLKKCVYFHEKNDVAILEIANPDDRLPLPMVLRKEYADESLLDEVSIIGYGHPKRDGKYLDHGCRVVHPGGKEIENAKKWLETEKAKNNIYKTLQRKHPNKVELEYEPCDEPDKLIFHCFIENGASGAPIIRFSQHGKAVEVIGVLTRGLPALYFCLTAEQKKLFPDENRFECGSRMSHIFKALEAEDEDLAAHLDLPHPEP